MVAGVLARAWMKAALIVLVVGVLLAIALSVLAGSARSAPGDKLYWTDPGVNKIQRSNLDGTNVEDVLTGVDVFDIGIDSAGGKMYWTGGGDVHRANLDGTAVETLVLDGFAASLSLDLVNDRIYWASGNRISRANLDGSSSEVILDVGEPIYGVGADPLGGIVYFSVFGTLKVTTLNGSGAATAKVGLFFGDIAVDVSSRDLYYIESKCCFLPGTDLGWVRGPVAGNPSPANSVAVDSITGEYYWTQYALEYFGVPLIGQPAIMRGTELLVDSVTAPANVAVFNGDAPPLPTPTAPPSVGGIAFASDLRALPAETANAGTLPRGIAVAIVATLSLVFVGGAAWSSRRRYSR